MAIGAIVHSELRGNLKMFGWFGDSLLRAFNLLTRVDELYLAIVREDAENKKKQKETKKSDDVISTVAGMQPKPKAVVKGG